MCGPSGSCDNGSKKKGNLKCKNCGHSIVNIGLNSVTHTSDYCHGVGRPLSRLCRSKKCGCVSPYPKDLIINPGHP